MELENQNNKYAPSGGFTEDFSSTAKLAHELALRKSEEASEPYNPLEHRNVKRPNSDLGTLAHLLKTFLGSGILAMPFAFKHGGLIFGLVGTIIIGIIRGHCCTMLVECSHILGARARVPSMTFDETAKYAFSTGPVKIRKFAGTASKMTQFQLVLSYLMSLVICIIFVASSIEQVVEHFLEPKIDIRLYILMLWVPLMIICLIRDLKRLVPFSVIANIFILLSFGITLYYMFREVKDVNDRDMIAPVDEMPLFFSTVIFAMEGIGTIMPIENQMKNPKHMLERPWIFHIAMTFVIIICSVIGFFGYLEYGDGTSGSVTLDLDEKEILANVVKILMALAIFFTYALQIYVPTTIIWDRIQHKFQKEKQSLYNHGMRMLTLAGTVLLAVAIPNLGPVISLVGAICFSILGLLLPAVIDMATRWESPGFGFLKWRLCKDIIISLVAIFALVTGTYSSILDIIDKY